MAGYKNYSMSNNAVAAYENNEKPLSKWTKSDIIEAVQKCIKENEISISFDMEILKKAPVKVLRDNLLYRSSWHHTSSMYNKTDFYSINDTAISTLTNERLQSIIDISASKKTEQSQPKPEKWECEFLVWSGTRKHPKATKETAIGVIKGNWLYLEDGTKKSVNAKGFYKIRRIDERSSVLGDIKEIKTEQAKEPKSAPEQGQKKARSNAAEIS